MERPSTSKVYTHPSFQRTILPHLRPLLPYPLPLYRRLQHPFHSPHSRVLATFPPADARADKLPPCFAVAYVDRSRRPETECWVFVSAEVPGEHYGGGGHGGADVLQCRGCAKALYAVLEHIRTMELPPSAHLNEDNNPATEAPDDMISKEFDDSRKALLAYLENPSVVLLGAVSGLVRQILNWVLLAPKRYAAGEFPYEKYLFSIEAVPTSNGALSDDLRWGTVRERDLALVKSRSSIPRQNGTLRLLPSLAIFPNAVPTKLEPGPIAWAFLGLDASLSALWVEPPYRGRGLAKKLSAKLMREGLGSVFDTSGEDGGGFAHTDTSSDNAESNSVFKSLGGRQAWTVYWIRVDLDRVREPLTSDALEAIAKLDADLPKRERLWEQSSNGVGL